MDGERTSLEARSRRENSGATQCPPFEGQRPRASSRRRDASRSEGNEGRQSAGSPLVPTPISSLKLSPSPISRRPTSRRPLKHRRHRNFTLTEGRLAPLRRVDRTKSCSGSGNHLWLAPSECSWSAGEKTRSFPAVVTASTAGSWRDRCDERVRAARDFWRRPPAGDFRGHAAGDSVPCRR